MNCSKPIYTMISALNTRFQKSVQEVSSIINYIWLSWPGRSSPLIRPSLLPTFLEMDSGLSKKWGIQNLMLTRSSCFRLNDNAEVYWYLLLLQKPANRSWYMSAAWICLQNMSILQYIDIYDYIQIYIYIYIQTHICIHISKKTSAEFFYWSEAKVYHIVSPPHIQGPRYVPVYHISCYMYVCILHFPQSQILGTFCLVTLFSANRPETAKQGRKSRRGRSDEKGHNHVHNICESYFPRGCRQIKGFSAPSEPGNSKTMPWFYHRYSSCSAIPSPKLFK